MLTIEETVTRIIGDHLGIPGATLPLDAYIVQDLGADSLDREELIMTIEERFHINIPKDVAARIERITDIVAFLQTTVPQLPPTEEDQI